MFAAVPVLPLSAAVPAFRILPGANMTALAPSVDTGSMVVHRWRSLSSACVGVAISDDPAARRRPSGRTKSNG